MMSCSSQSEARWPPPLDRGEIKQQQYIISNSVLIGPVFSQSSIIKSLMDVKIDIDLGYFKDIWKQIPLGEKHIISLKCFGRKNVI